MNLLQSFFWGMGWKLGAFAADMLVLAVLALIIYVVIKKALK